MCAGDSRCFLFTVFPTLRVFTTTGYNDHFMYLNQHQQTMPNGLVRPPTFTHFYTVFDIMEPFAQLFVHVSKFVL